MKKIILLFGLVFLIVFYAGIVIAPENSPENNTECKYYYWFDNENRVCGYKQYCGMYMYYGLRTFNTKDECEKELNPSNVTQTCTDSDGGINYYVKGVCKSYGEIAPDICLQDSQNPSIIHLNEKSCSSDNSHCLNELYICPNGCKDGACIQSNITFTCTDSDKGKNYYVKGKTFGQNVPRELEDFCIKEYDYGAKVFEGTGVAEHFCDENGNVKPIPYTCPNGCKDGACIKEGAECKSDGDCPLACSLCGSSGGPNYEECTQCYKIQKKCINGKCQIMPTESVSEQVKCVFKNSKENQKCYTAEENSRAVCEGTETCIADIKGYKDEKITWKSSCGGYAYTKMDGENKYAEFECGSGETNITQIKNMGFRYAYWQCYDGFEEKQGGETSCKPSEIWQEYAKKSCEGHCYKDKSKCGVNSFSVHGDCYDETIPQVKCNPLEEDVSECCKEWANKNNIEIPDCVGGWNIEYDKCYYSCKEGEEIIPKETLVCKDSCPMDDKCYPFGYRKSGKYCSDEGKFNEEKDGKKSCDNNFECKSNVCVNDECVSEGLIKRILNWFNKMFGKE